ncbi:MAG: hypothetical protein R3338_02155 [Thermoanaerobaculia bacterium]|nr:hypothetical protein [Thermoanaerobaculia bacterium]
MKRLHEAILTRDLERVTELVRAECDRSATDARDDILRFSVLAFSPSLHSRSTMYAALASAELFEQLEDPCPLIIACARYAAESHVPWGKAPVTDPPRYPASFIVDAQSIDEAIEQEDIHEGERWLAALLESDVVATSFFDAAARHAGEEGYGFCTAAAAWKIAQRFPPQVRFAVFRTALREWLQSRPMPAERSDLLPGECTTAAIDSYVRSGGEPALFPPLLLCDAVALAERVTSDPGRYSNLLRRYVTPPEESLQIELGSSSWSEADLAYRYASDYAMFLLSVPLTERLSRIAASDLCEQIPAAARRFLQSSEGFEDWSFA